MDYGYSPVFLDLNNSVAGTGTPARFYENEISGRQNGSLISSNILPSTNSQVATPAWLAKENRGGKGNWDPQFRLLVNIIVNVRLKYQIGHIDSKKIKGTPQFNIAVSTIFKQFNAANKDKLDYANKETWELVAELLQNQAIHARKGQKKQASKNIANGNNNENFDAILMQHEEVEHQHFIDGEFVAIYEIGKLKCSAKVTNAAPTGVSGNFLFDSLEVKFYINLTDDTFEPFALKIVPKEQVLKIDASMNTINGRLSGFLEAINNDNAMEDEAAEDVENPRCNIAHKVGDLLAFDLGSKYASYWPLIGEISTIKQGGAKYEIIWMWPKQSDIELDKSTMQQRFGRWEIRDKPLIEICKASSHFCCNFSLEDRRLPRYIQETIGLRMKD